VTPTRTNKTARISTADSQALQLTLRNNTYDEGVKMLTTVHPWILRAVVFALVVAGTGCGGGGGGGSSSLNFTPPQPLIVSGALKVEGDPPPAKHAPAKAAVLFEAGRIVVGLREGERHSDVLRDHDHLGLSLLQAMTEEGPYLLKLRVGGDESKPVTDDPMVRAAIDVLAADLRVRYAEPNYLAFPKAEPNDPLYADQWHYRLINLPVAWSVTTGASSIVVAVIDSGIRLDHPDLADNLVSGHDFISDAALAEDGDGRDSDPSDPFVSGTYSSFHGTHVAGTIGAVSNNRLGVAGVAWGIRMQPVRALGNRGGASFDIASAIRWSAGLSVMGVPSNATPARVINMSLGGPAFAQIQKDAVDQASAAGAILVAAAGNDSSPEPMYPAALNHVINVSSVNIHLSRASYSNQHATVFLAAPGGQVEPDEDQGVLSTVADSDSQELTYRFLDGTSMAAPHVAGVVALMLSAQPTLDENGVRAILASTAVDLGPPGRDAEFGFGLVDAGEAVRLAASAVTPPPVVDVQPTRMVFESHVTAGRILVRNAGGGALAIQSVTVDTRGTGNWLVASLTGTTAPATIALSVHRGGLPLGRFQADVTVVTSAGTRTVLVEADNFPITNVGPIEVALVSATNSATLATTTTDFARGYRYELRGSVPDDAYYIVASADRDGDSKPWTRVDEFLGVWPLFHSPTPISVVSGTASTDVDFHVIRLGDLFVRSGIGGGPLAGALSVRVRDGATGRPIRGASVLVDSIGVPQLTDRRGRVTISSPALAGPRFVSVSAPGYGTRSVAGLQAQCLGLSLEPPVITSTATVTLTGLDSLDDFGTVAISSHLGEDVRIFTGGGPTSVTVTLEAASGAPAALAAVTFDASGVARKVGFVDPDPEVDFATGTTLTMSMFAPAGFRLISGSITKPQGGVFVPAGSTDIALFSIYGPLGTYYHLAYLGISAGSSYSMDIPSFGPDFDATNVGLLVIGSGDTAGRFTYAAKFDWLDAFFGTLNATLADCPGLAAPGAGALTSRTPTFGFATPIGASTVTLRIRDTTTNLSWEVLAPGATTGIALPLLQTGGLVSGRTYEWSVAAKSLFGFDFNEQSFDEDEIIFLMGSTTSESRTFIAQ